MDGKLFFADGVNELRKLNIQRAKNYVDLVSNIGLNFNCHFPNTVLVSPYEYIYVNGWGVLYYSHGGFDGIDYNVGDAVGTTGLELIYNCYFFSPLYNDYQKTWNQDQLSLNKPPCLETINASYYNDPSFIGNYVSEKAFKFKIKNIYTITRSLFGVLLRIFLLMIQLMGLVRARIFIILLVFRFHVQTQTLRA